MTRRLTIVLLATFLSALVTLPVAAWTWWINFPHVDVVSLLVIAFDFWLLFVLVLFLPIVLHELVRRGSATLRTDVIAGLSASFFLLWFIRLEGPHQLVSVRPHLSGAGFVGLAAIAIATILIYLAGLRRTVAFIALAAILSLALEGLARAQAPARRRDDAIKQLTFAASPIAQTNRVLMIGIDGMDWRVVAHFIKQGKMPALASILRAGRCFEMDNLGMRMSPEIWSAVYTGVPARLNGVDSFLRWDFAGARRSVVALPKFGVHSVFFMERLLWYLRPLHLWSATYVNNKHITATPLWTALSARGKRIAVIDPVPVPMVPERVNGTFAIVRNSFLSAFSGNKRADFPLPNAESPRSFMSAERVRVAATAELLRREPFDDAIYYTSFLDAVQHLTWDFACPDCFVKGGGSGESIDGAAFARSDIAAAYLQADQTIAALVAAFGQPARIVLVSDHGWDYNDYEHFNSPHGMYVVSPSPNPGYGGIAPVLAIEPAVLAMTGVAPAPGARREFIVENPEDEERLKRLKALGYIGR